MKRLSDHDIAFIRDVVFRESSMSMKDRNVNSVISRMDTVARREGIASINDLVQRIRSADFEIIKRVVEEFTINETSFNRDRGAFDVLTENTIPELIAEESRNITIWSAGCSTGQEVCSMGMALFKKSPDLLGRVRIVGTDISERVIKKARDALYTEFELRRGVDESHRNQYFIQVGDNWRLIDEIRVHTEFHSVNLHGNVKKFIEFADVVFLRNVLLYFDDKTKYEVLRNVRGVMAPDGVLFLGSSECALEHDTGFTRIPSDGSHCYRLN